MILHLNLLQQSETADSAHIVFTGFTNSEATIEFQTYDPATLHLDEFTLTTPNGKVVTYKISNASGTSGTIPGGTTKTYIYISGAGSYDAVTDQVKLAIEVIRGSKQ